MDTKLNDRCLDLIDNLYINHVLSQAEYQVLYSAASSLNDAWAEHAGGLEDKITAIQADNQRLQQWVNDLQSGMYINCVYCGHRYGPRSNTPVSMADVLKAHVEKCPKHPMSALKVENERLKAELDDKAGAWIRRPDTGIGDLSDGYHTFNELYHHRAVLFSLICNAGDTYAWKARYHHDGSMFPGMFIIGFETKWGQATYHYDIDPYWDMFKVKELERAPEWDGHTADDAIHRLYLLGQSSKRTDEEMEGSGHENG